MGLKREQIITLTNGILSSLGLTKRRAISIFMCMTLEESKILRRMNIVKEMVKKIMMMVEADLKKENFWHFLHMIQTVSPERGVLHVYL